jgi:hypothetical protein
MHNTQSTATLPGTQPSTRFDLYLSVHKGLRAFMSDVLTTVGRVDPADATEVADGLAQVRALLDICREHLHTENQFLHTAMEARRSGSACETANQHVEHEKSFERIESKVLGIERSSEREVKLLDLYRELSLFVADNFQHMHIEERDNNETLWAHYTDDELHRIHDELLASIEPAKKMANLRWMIPFVTHGERVEILSSMKQTLPGPVFERVLSLIKPHLNDRDRRKLSFLSSHLN